MNIRTALGSQWIATIYIASVSMLLVVMIARGLGPEKFGVYSYVLSLSSIFSILQDGGFKTLLFREGTSKSNHLSENVYKLLPIALGHVIITTIIGCGIAILIPWPYRSALNAGVFCFGLVAISGFITAFWKGLGKFEKSALWQALVRTLTALVIFVAFGLGLRNVAGLYICWAFGISIAIALPLGRIAWLKLPIFPINTDVYRSCSAFIVIDLATMIYFRCDIILLKYLQSDVDEVGQYAAAYRLLEGLIMLMTPIAHICFRYLRLSWQRQNEFNRIFLKMLLGMAVIAISIYCAGLVFGKYLVLRIYGSKFQSAAELTILLLPALIFILPNYIITQAMVAMNKEKIYAFIAIFAAGLNISGNYFLIPIYGAKGAAFATILTEASLFFILIAAYWSSTQYRKIENTKKASN